MTNFADSSDFLKIIAMNLAFGNHAPESTPSDESATYHMGQAIKMANSEFVEWEEARALMNVEEQADAIMDAIVFLVGGLYKAGIDPMQTLDNVLEALMTRFIKDEKDMEDTYKMYEAMGLARDDIAVEGAFPNMVFRSKIEKFNFECQKFLKSKNNKKPIPWDRKNKNPRMIFNSKLTGVSPPSEGRFKIAGKLPQKSGWSSPVRRG